MSVPTFELALQHMRTAGLPFADEAHLTVQRETSNKEPASRQAWDDPLVQ